MDKTKRSASHAYVSPYLLRPLRTLSEAMRDCGMSIELPSGEPDARHGLPSTASMPTPPQQPVASPTEARSGATVVWLSNRTATAGQMGRPDQ